MEIILLVTGLIFISEVVKRKLILLEKFVIDAEGNLVLTHMGMGDYNTKDFKKFLEDQI